MCVELRYYAKENVYYFRIQENEYFRIENKIRRLRREISRIRDKNSAEYLNLSGKLKKLKEEKETHQYYVAVSSTEITENMNARPMYHKPLSIISASGDELKKLFKETNRLSI